MKTENITMLPGGDENLGVNTALETRQEPDISFSGLFIGYGALDAQIYAQENPYNIFEDERYQHDIIIEFDNHYIENTVLQSSQKTQFDNAREAIKYLQSLKILPLDNTENAYQKFLEEIDIEIFENLSYPIAITTTDDTEVLGAPRDSKYVTLMITTNNFVGNEKKDMEISRGLTMSIPFLEKTSKMCIDYDFYKNAYLYNIYVYQEHPETKQKN